MAQDLIEETYGYAKEAEVYQMAMDFPFKDQDKDLTHHLMDLFRRGQKALEKRCRGHQDIGQTTLHSE
jgi:hypothetical protein